MPQVLLGVFIKILKVDTKVGLEKKYAVILSSFFLFIFIIQWKYSIISFFMMF